MATWLETLPASVDREVDDDLDNDGVTRERSLEAAIVLVDFAESESLAMDRLSLNVSLIA